ncbi:hypothetical protein, partial [Methylogaea oryzae]|uniref:hypothetical protein n=1 Tax=Methylogaea oryzae TaxID=1295382 RepID=UPI00138F21EA
AYAAATEPADTGLPAMHAIHNNRLQQAMDRINTLVYRQMRDEVNASVETRQQTQEVAKTASELSGTVEAIIATLPALRLNPGDQATFRRWPINCACMPSKWKSKPTGTKSTPFRQPWMPSPAPALLAIRCSERTAAFWKNAATRITPARR